MKLSDVFTAVAFKRLVAGDLPDAIQHEINGNTALRDFFQTSEKLIGDIHWHFFNDDQEPSSESGSFTFYNTRANRPQRSPEWRLYYTGDFLHHAVVDDTLILVRDRSGRIYGLIFAQHSGWLRAARVLFGFNDGDERFSLYDEPALDEHSLAFVRQQILDELGIEVVIPSLPSDEELVVSTFGMNFPSTRVMSELARSLVQEEQLDDDALLVRWIERELQLFTALERHIVWERIQKGFESVEDFLSYSKSVQNRRKSRMGHALENHLEALFVRHHLRFERGVATEGKNKPDFLFPGSAEYRDPEFDAALLVMLGAKSTLKDRWRQVLTEAERIPNKHLCTLEAAISVDQTTAMRHSHVILVIPAGIHETYTQGQQQDLLSIAAFIEHVRRTQS